MVSVNSSKLARTYLNSQQIECKDEMKLSRTSWVFLGLVHLNQEQLSSRKIPDLTRQLVKRNFKK